MKNGWVKIHRKLWTNAISKKPAYAWLWITLLAMANHKGTEFIWNNKKVNIKPGQLLTGRKALSDKTGINSSTVYRILEYLENEQQIEQQKTTKFTVITITKWDRYQQREQQNEQQANNKRTTSEHIQECIRKNKNTPKGVSYGNKLINFFEKEYKRRFEISPTYYSRKYRRRRIWNLVSRKVFQKSTKKIGEFLQWLEDYCEGNNITITKLDTVIEKADLWSQI